MADGSSQADIRGLDIDKLAKGFADEMFVLRKFFNNSTTKNQEMRWYQKTSGILDTAVTSGMTGSGIANTAKKARPRVVEQTWTRLTSYAKKFFVESPLISDEDIKGSDLDIIATNIRDLVRAVSNQVEKRCYEVITEGLSPSTINTAAATGTGWDDLTNGNPIKDVLTGQQKIRSYGYEPKGAILYINSVEHFNLMNFLIVTKGASIPSYSSEQVKKAVVMEFLGTNVVVSENATTDNALMFVPQRAATWKSFVGLSSGTITEMGMGKKIRVWEEGEALLTDPKAVHLITDTVT